MHSTISLYLIQSNEQKIASEVEGARLAPRAKGQTKRTSGA
jgi:hypothetical protein